MIFLDYRDCIRNNNNNDLLKYASLIIITDNRGGKRDRPLAVKHSFVVEFLTSRIFNIILPETLITTLLKSPAIFTGHAESAKSTFVRLQIQRRKFSTPFFSAIYQSVKNF